VTTRGIKTVDYIYMQLAPAKQKAYLRLLRDEAWEDAARILLKKKPPFKCDGSLLEAIKHIRETGEGPLTMPDFTELAEQIIALSTTDNPPDSQHE